MAGMSWTLQSLELQVLDRSTPRATCGNAKGRILCLLQGDMMRQSQAWSPHRACVLHDGLDVLFIQSSYRLLEFPKVVPVTALSTPNLDLALTDTSWTCGLNVIPLSRVTPKTCRVFSTGIGMPLSDTRGWVAHSLVSGVTSVSTHLPGSTSILLVASQNSNCPM